jgi:hypothetical protein
MSKAYKKERKGLEQGSFVSPEAWPSAHTPEEEQAFQKLVKELQPIMMQAVQQAISVYVEENYDVHEGNIIQYIIQYITNYIDRRTIGATFVAGPGIDASALGAGVIKVYLGSSPEGLEFSGDRNNELHVDYGDGIELDGSKIEAQCNKGIDKNASGIFVDLHSSVQTTYEASGCGLEIDPDSATGKLRVVPTHFLKTADD